MSMYESSEAQPAQASKYPNISPGHEAHLRDQFAAAAITGLLARGAHDHDKRDGKRYFDLAYEIADGMLEARKK